MTADEVADFLESVFPDTRARFAIEEVGVRSARVRMHYGDQLLRPGGTLSGPSLMALADTAMWAALLAMIGPVALSVTVNLNIDFLRKPGPVDAIAETRILKLGKRLAVGDVLISSEGDPEPVAHASVTYAIPSDG
jgi:uncharacterized protein (TIGR00369 family)